MERVVFIDYGKQPGNQASAAGTASPGNRSTAPGGTLAFTSVCRTLGPSKQIVGFQTVFDADDTWSNSGDAGKSDIRATATHEEGHTIGLDHVTAPRDARLTMYPFITDGDIGLRTLGCGDRLGVNALYGTSSSCTGVPLD